MARGSWRVWPGLVLALAVWPSEAHSEPTDADVASAWQSHPVAVHGVVSMPGGPIGLVGAEVVVSPVARIGAALGAGLGLNSDVDGWRGVPRVAASLGYRAWMARKGEDTGAAGFWLTGSAGPYHEHEFTIESGVSDQRYEIERAYFFGAAFVGERRYASGLSLRGSVGLELLVNSADGRCYERPHGSEAQQRIACDRVNRLTLAPFFPSASLAIGYAL